MEGKQILDALLISNKAIDSMIMVCYVSLILRKPMIRLIRIFCPLFLKKWALGGSGSIGLNGAFFSEVFS